MSRKTNRISRRGFLKGLAGGAASVAAVSSGIPVWGKGKTHLDFMVWTYGVQTILDNIQTFEQQYPDITVKLHDFPWTKYHSSVVLRFKAKTPTDLLYNGENWLAEWALPGWVAPLEEYFPKVLDYKNEIAGYALSAMTYNNKLYGLPYYADLITFMYNEKVLEDNGFTAPPSTWEEVKDYSLKLKDGGMDKPIIWEIAEDLPTFGNAFWSMVYGRGQRPFDDDLNPVFQNPDHAAFKHLQWYVDTINKWKIATSLPHEAKIYPAMGSGKHAFTVMYNYNLKQLNNPEVSPKAGEFKIALMPGKAHHCYGFARFYCMTQMAANRGGDVREACWKFIEYFGGKVDGEYKVVKRWALEKGLGFAQLPLFDDPDVRKSWSEWINMDGYKKQAELAWGPKKPVWYGIWDPLYRSMLVQALHQEIPVEKALANAAKKWNELKAQFT